MPLSKVPQSLHEDGSIGTAQLADSGVTTVKLADGTVTTVKVADGAITPVKMTQKPTVGTSQATTSGTSKDFTGIPSWVQKITLSLRGVSLNGTSGLLVQIGSGSVQNTGYVSTSCYAATGNQAGSQSATSGFVIVFGSASQVFSGHVVLTHMGSNIWVASHSGGLSATIAAFGGGDVALSGALDRVRLTSVNGTDAFDAGSVNILYEG